MPNINEELNYILDQFNTKNEQPQTADTSEDTDLLVQKSLISDETVLEGFMIVSEENPKPQTKEIKELLKVQKYYSRDNASPWKFHTCMADHNLCSAIQKGDGTTEFQCSLGVSYQQNHNTAPTDDPSEGSLVYTLLSLLCVVTILGLCTKTGRKAARNLIKSCVSSGSGSNKKRRHSSRKPDKLNFKTLHKYDT